MLRSGLRGLVLVLCACGPAVSADDGGSGDATGDTADGGEAESTDEGDPDPDPRTDVPDTTPPLSADEQLCLDLCLNFEATAADCGRADESCYQWCLGRVQGAPGDTCADEIRAAVECEAEASQFDDFCSTTECADPYVRLELCSGYCFYFGGSPGGGGSPTECDWRSSCSDGRLYEMVCTVGEAGTPCGCFIDDEEVGTCDAERAIPAFDCGGDDLHVFTGCCRPFFEAVLLP